MSIHYVIEIQAKATPFKIVIRPPQLPSGQEDSLCLKMVGQVFHQVQSGDDACYLI